MSQDVAQLEKILHLMKLYGIGLTGGIGTGKSSVGRIIAAEGIPVVDADRLARIVVARGTPGLAAVIAEFGSDMVTPEGTLDRKKLGAVVFGNHLRLRCLEKLLHPLIWDALCAELTALGLVDQPRLFFYENAILFENAEDNLLRSVWATLCSEEEQLKRVMDRDSATSERVRAVLSSQMSAKEKAERAGLVIDTSPPQAMVEDVVRRELIRLKQQMA